MAITNWATLKSAVQTYVARSDTTFVNQIPLFVSNAEERIFHGVGMPVDPLFSEPLRADEMLTATTLAMTSGAGTIPADCLAVRRLDRDSDTIGIQPLSPDAFAMRVAHNDSGRIRWYTIEGRTIKTAPGGYTGNINILYYARPTGISEANTTNVVLTARPMLYLYGTLLEAFTFINADDKAQKYLAMFRSLMSGVNRTAVAIEYGGGKKSAKPRSNRVI
jgi:hypothetical protein